MPKSEILKHGVLEQSKEEVIIQVGLSQTKRLSVNLIYDVSDLALVNQVALIHQMVHSLVVCPLAVCLLLTWTSSSHCAL